ncbi:transcriptional regulator [Leptolyngbya boryana NIES-2135]|jgi:AcrR family transcriptional regulator|uniref:Transcriptional regulator n=1 Tax=Leptolyngbya boryana NIES-2135 TaxID=1973484 RepID=A0A1Z4JCD1_LEPBY|nr:MULTISPECIES: TetR/AcrR family transcriptional regulator [Leptolyngbya]BAY54419.1 transcriptional regulator [Leptolyngbya boryana NIES-2135]MBD2370073.1 TetR family transcriptional regulator [Leptolyngbya sp. FACHB-161]MBD2376460.1 TetR family transcriptional regulator [Leptolyngbya sp. FACHB-238]MBD2400734.1 TetR family transcriptional regulator [Leptolyngbya sp. FACHB-239]MBD2407277.1 TetR family transcriptional regulator [Leptolyngbya sp. FACHB-402]
MSPKPPATPRKQPKQERSQVTVEAILSATAHILTENGYNQLTTNRVAERAGVSIGSLYQYFPNKEALIFALAEQHANEMVQLAKQHLEGLSDRTIPEVLRQIIKAALAAHAVNPKLHRVLHEQIPHSEVMKRLDQAKIENLLQSFLAQRSDQLRPKNLELAVFMVERTIRALIYGAMIDHPELLKTGELEQELTLMLSAYLVKS